MLTNGRFTLTDGDAEAAAAMLLMAYEAADGLDLPQNVHDALRFAAFVAKRMLPDDESRRRALRTLLIDLANALPT